MIKPSRLDIHANHASLAHHHRPVGDLQFLGSERVRLVVSEDANLEGGGGGFQTVESDIESVLSAFSSEPDSTEDGEGLGVVRFDCVGADPSPSSNRVAW